MKKWLIALLTVCGISATQAQVPGSVVSGHTPNEGRVIWNANDQLLADSIIAVKARIIPNDTSGVLDGYIFIWSGGTLVAVDTTGLFGGAGGGTMTGDAIMDSLNNADRIWTDTVTFNEFVAFREQIIEIWDSVAAGVGGYGQVRLHIRNWAERDTNQTAGITLILDSNSVNAQFQIRARQVDETDGNTRLEFTDNTGNGIAYFAGSDGEWYFVNDAFFQSDVDVTDSLTAAYLVGNGAGLTGLLLSAVAGLQDSLNKFVEYDDSTTTFATPTQLAAKLDIADTASFANQLVLKAPIEDPSFTGTVTLPTGLSGTVRAASGVVSATPSDTIGLAAALAAASVTITADAIIDSLNTVEPVLITKRWNFADSISINILVAADGEDRWIAVQDSMNSAGTGYIEADALTYLMEVGDFPDTAGIADGWELTYDGEEGFEWTADAGGGSDDSSHVWHEQDSLLALNDNNMTIGADDTLQGGDGIILADGMADGGVFIDIIAAAEEMLVMDANADTVKGLVPGTGVSIATASGTDPDTLNAASGTVTGDAIEDSLNNATRAITQDWDFAADVTADYVGITDNTNGARLSVIRASGSGTTAYVEADNTGSALTVVQQDPAGSALNVSGESRVDTLNAETVTASEGMTIGSGSGRALLTSGVVSATPSDTVGLGDSLAGKAYDSDLWVFEDADSSEILMVNSDTSVTGVYMPTLDTTGFGAADSDNFMVSVTAGKVVLALAPGAGGGEANTGSNLGGGLDNYSTKVSEDLQFNTFAAADFDLGSNLISIDAAKWAPLASPTFTGTVTMPTGLTGRPYLTSGVLSIRAEDTVGLGANLFAKAPTASPTFTGTFTAPVGLSGTARLASGVLSATPSDSVGLGVALALLAPIASPTFTGTFTAPTGLTGTARLASGVLSATASDTVGLGVNLFNKQALDADLTTLSAPTVWSIFYSDGSQDIQELTVGAAGTRLSGNGVTSAPTWIASDTVGLGANLFAKMAELTDDALWPDTASITDGWQFTYDGEGGYEWTTPGAGGGEANDGVNLGSGLDNFNDKDGVNLRFNTFAAADFDLASNLITIDATKWAPLASPTFTGTFTAPVGLTGTARLTSGVLSATASDTVGLGANLFAKMAELTDDALWPDTTGIDDGYEFTYDGEGGYEWTADAGAGGSDGQDADSIMGIPIDTTGPSISDGGIRALVYNTDSLKHKFNWMAEFDTANFSAADSDAFVLSIADAKVVIAGIDPSDTIGLGASLFGKQDLDADLTTLSAPTVWSIWYSDGSQDIQELTVGGAGTRLSGNGATAAPTWIASDTVGLGVNLALLAPIASPTFTGTFTAPVGLSGTARLASGVLSATAADTVGLGADLFNKQGLDADLTTLAVPTVWSMFYSDGSQVQTEFTVGAAGTRLSGNGVTSAPTWIASDTVGLGVDLALLAPLASPTFTGTFTAPVGLTGTARLTSGVLSATASDTVGLGANLAGKSPLAGSASLVTVGTGAINTAEVEAELKTEVISFTVKDTVLATEVLYSWKVPYDITITEIAGWTDANTTTFNVEERAETTPNTPGTDAMASDLAVDNDQEEQTSFDNAGFAANTWLTVVTSATGDVNTLTISIRYTID